MIISVDFDGVICKNKYPDIGTVNINMVHKLINCKRNGDILILNTCRHDTDLEKALRFCKVFGLEFDYVNENAKEMIERFGDCRKIGADIYIDDKNVSIGEFLNETTQDDVNKRIKLNTDGFGLIDINGVLKTDNKIKLYKNKKYLCTVSSLDDIFSIQLALTQFSDYILENMGKRK